MLQPILAPLSTPEGQRVLNERLSEISTALEQRASAAQAAPKAAGISGTHQLRVKSYPAALQAAGTPYWETDRTVLYIVIPEGVNGRKWRYVSGTFTGLTAARPTDLGTTDAGFRFLDTTLNRIQIWSGTAWANEIVPNTESSGGLRAQGAATGYAGVGTEVYYSTADTSGYVIAYDRTGGAFKMLDLEGLCVVLNSISTGNVRIGTKTDDGSGAKLQVSGAVNATGYEVGGTQVVGARGVAVADVTLTAGGTYTANEAAMLAALKAQLNTLLARCRAHGLIA